MADIVFPGKPISGVIGREFLPANFDLEVYKGDYLSLRVALKDSTEAPLQLSGYTAKSQIRAPAEGGAVYELQTSINTATGEVDLLLPSTVSATMPPGDYIWDFQLTNPGGNTRTYLAGDVKVHAEVTR